jgi:hypothetical protein
LIGSIIEEHGQAYEQVLIDNTLHF